MWALVNKDNYVIDCFIEITLEEAEKRVTDGRYLVKMTEKNSPAHLGGYYDGHTFHKPMSSDLVEKDYIPFVYIKHNLV